MHVLELLGQNPSCIFWRCRYQQQAQRGRTGIMPKCVTVNMRRTHSIENIAATAAVLGIQNYPRRFLRIPREENDIRYLTFIGESRVTAASSSGEPTQPRADSRLNRTKLIPLRGGGQLLPLGQRDGILWLAAESLQIGTRPSSVRAVRAHTSGRTRSP